MSSAQQSLVCVTGLPRAGSTLLCQLLAEHPEIECDRMSSPLLGALQALRGHLSDSDFLLARLDGEFDQTYQRLQRSSRAFAAAWWNTDRPIVVDKHRGWLSQLELALELAPQARMLVCVRELSQVLGSIEAQHRRTVWLDFPDDLANLAPYARAEALFAPAGVVGGPLRAIQGVQDRSSQEQQRLFFVVFEHLIQDPAAVMAEIFGWLGLSPWAIDPQALTVKPHEADSYYRFKYCHRTFSAVRPLPVHSISPRITEELQNTYRWFYELFYPGLLP
jgi:sulfotransferase